MKLSEFDYELLPELIAQDPLPERDASRLLHVLPEAGLEHLLFAALPDLLEPGDVLVVNDTKVFPARLTGTRASGAASSSCCSRISAKGAGACSESRLAS